MDAWFELGETFRNGANEPNSSSSNKNQAPYRDEAGDEGVATTAPRSQRSSGGKLCTTNQRLAATRRPLPMPSHLQHDTTSDVPDDEPAAPKKGKADTASSPPVKGA
jgi:hypothetical protein